LRNLINVWYNRYDMIINKASWVTDGDNVRLSMPFGKVDQERRLVSGFASLDNIDKQMDIVTTEASMSAFAKFRGNIREMHQPSAVGKMISFKEEKYFDPESKKFYKGVYVSTYISKGAQDAWEKVLDGTYTGFSIGGRMNKWDDAYDDTMEKQIRIIKDYDLIELSLVDSPANQFASIMSVEKVDGVDMIKADNTVLENVFYDKESGLVIVSEEETQVSPATGQEMKNIGFVEKDDLEKANMIKFLVDSAKGISTIKITKEVNPMTEATAIAVESAVEEVEVTPEAQPAVVEETPAVAEEAPVAQEAPAAEPANGSAESLVAPAAETVENTADKADSLEANATASNEEIVKAVSDIKDSLTNAFGDLASTVKSLHEQIMTLSKSLESVTSEVKEVKGTFDEFGKRVDDVVADTAFRKSGDLGEIVQFEPLKVQKSLWGGRFLTSTDLFN
jgi:hypothetical protein